MHIVRAMSKDDEPSVSARTSDGKVDLPSLVLLQELPETLLDSNAVLAFLEPYGYVANNARSKDSSSWWQGPIPELSLQVTGHSKSAGHTYYHINCALANAGEWHSPYLEWRTGRRLAHLRQGLHDIVKRELVDVYRERFGDVHFAHASGPRQIAVPGTTGRLDKWSRRLALVINKKEAPPILVGSVLKCLGVPDAATIRSATERGATGKPSGWSGSQIKRPPARPPAAEDMAASSSASGAGYGASNTPVARASSKGSDSNPFASESDSDDQLETLGEGYVVANPF